MKIGFKRPPFSEEWKKKISEAHKRRKTLPPSRKGAKMSEEAKLKIAIFQKTQKRSLETRVKMGEAKRGVKNKSWAGGVSPINMSIRRSAKYRMWRNENLIRDNYQCIWCGSKEKLQVDHIKSFAKFPELRFELTNGRTLCERCHRTTETYGRPKKQKTILLDTTLVDTRGNRVGEK